VVSDTQRTQVSAARDGRLRRARLYLQHRRGCDAKGDNTISWVFKWKAPPQKVGRVDFWLALVAANNNGQATGDSVYLRTLSFDPAIAPLATVSAASFLPNQPVAPESIVAGLAPIWRIPQRQLTHYPCQRI
jgi:hypothetical protein